MKNFKLPFTFSSVFVLAAILSGCAMFDSRSNEKEPPKVRVKDVPIKARASVSAEIRKRVLVLPFLDAVSTRSDEVSVQARRAFVAQLLSTDQFVVIDNADFPKDLNTLKNGDDYDLREISKLAQGLGVSAVLEGKIIDLNAKKLSDQVGLFRKVKASMEATVRLRLVATKNNRELLNETRSAVVEAETTQVGREDATEGGLNENPQLVREAITKAFRGLILPISANIRKMTWEGKIAMVSGERVFINAGRVSGLQLGDLLKVMDEGTDVVDPDSGEVIGQAPGRMKGTIEIVSYFGKDGAVAVIHSGSGFKEADQVELY
jgi:curli biogenesis system outer membrane secretion channel CsgG